MKVTLISTLSLLALARPLAAQTAGAPAFEGTIVYRSTVQYTDPVRKARFSKQALLMGTEETVTLQGANANVVTNGLVTEHRLYRLSERRLYTFFTSRPQVMWYNLSLHAPELLRRQVLPAADTVLGLVCDIVEVQTKHQTLRASLHPQFRATVAGAPLPDSTLYRALFYPSATNLVLRRVAHDDDGDITTSVATALRPGPVTDATLFAAPGPEAELLPNWGMLDNQVDRNEIAKFVRHMSQNIRYPKPARRAGIEGTVVLEFLVGADSRISDIQVLQSVEPSLDAEAVRVLQQFARWAPRTYHGQPVKSIFSVPVTYRLK